jgi:DNA-binding CsgD family transcriptional regulator
MMNKDAPREIVHDAHWSNRGDGKPDAAINAGLQRGGNMSEIRQVTEWRTPPELGAIYERLLAAIGTEEFGPTVKESLRTVTSGMRRLYLFEAVGSEENSLQYFSCEPGLADLFPLYLNKYLPLDPVCRAYRAASRASDVAVQRVRPSDIPSPGFRRRFFDGPGIVERVSVIQRGEDAWRVMTVCRHTSDGYFSDRELSSMVGLAWLVLPMLPHNSRQLPTPRQLTVGQLEERFAARYECLTVRERQVCARAAIGMSVEATALDLGIAKSSVLTYRQRAYYRLHVTSPFELSSLVTH